MVNGAKRIGAKRIGAIVSGPKELLLKISASP